MKAGAVRTAAHDRSLAYSGPRVDDDLETDPTAIGFARASAESLVWQIVEALERVLAFLLLLLASPVLLLCAGVIFLLCRRTPLIAHQRVGLGGRTIWVLKLRTMWPRAAFGPLAFVERVTDSMIASAPKRRSDPRVNSRFAWFCRKRSLDELPQLWNVVRGDMALVGPRPLTRCEIELHYAEDALELLSRKPGITGLWQVRGRSQLSYRKRRRLDLILVRKWALPLYLRVLVATIPTVIAGKNAW
jgi:exopolysaccharide production protein ExoY